MRTFTFEKNGKVGIVNAETVERAIELIRNQYSLVLTAFDLVEFTTNVRGSRMLVW